MSVLLLVFAVVAVRTTIRSWSTAGAPASAAYADYHRRLKRNLTVGIGVPVAVLVVDVVVLGFTTTDAAHGPWSASVSVALFVVSTPGLIVGPLLALLVTESTTRSTRLVATLAPRSLTQLVPRWLIVAATVATVVAVAVGVVGIACHSAPTHSDRDDGQRDTVALIVILVLAFVVMSVITRAALVRPDSDEAAPTDAWSRTGIAVRAVSLQLALAFFSLPAGITRPLRDAAFDNDGLFGLGESRAAMVVDLSSFVALCLAVASLSMFGRPELTRPLPASDRR